MNYFDNGPYLRSLQTSSTGSTNTKTIMLVTALVVVSGIAIYQGIKLQEQKGQLALLHKQVQDLQKTNQTLPDRPEEGDNA